jgi:hypothetical protein
MENQRLTPEMYASYFEKGISYAEYFANMTAEVENKIESPYAKYVPMNLQRVKRIGKTFKLNEEVATALENLDTKVNWLLISEHWCGDASQTVPIMAGIAAASQGKINLKLIYRDENPALMDAHLTNGGKSIAKLIQLDENFHFLGEWGPRPEEAQAYILKAKAEGIPYEIFSEHLHKWYADDKGVSTQLELLEILKIKGLA